VNKLEMITALTSFAVLPNCTIAHAQPPTSVAAPPRLVSVRAAKAPTVDGKADDEAWQAAKPLEVMAKRVMEPNIGVSTRLHSLGAYGHPPVLPRFVGGRDGAPLSQDVGVER